VFILKKVKVVCFAIVLQVLIIKNLHQCELLPDRGRFEGGNGSAKKPGTLIPKREYTICVKKVKGRIRAG
jgi:hypothetical protein